jgi:hypothetical protein
MFAIEIRKDGDVLVGHYNSQTKKFKFLLIQDWYEAETIEGIWEIWNVVKKDDLK